MRRIRPMLVLAAVAMLAACSAIPLPTEPGSARMDEGGQHGSGAGGRMCLPGVVTC